MSPRFAARDLFVQDCYAGADARYSARHQSGDRTRRGTVLFARNLFIADPDPLAPSHVADFTVIDLPGMKAEPARHGTRSEVVIAMNFARRLVLDRRYELRR